MDQMIAPECPNRITLGDLQAGVVTHGRSALRSFLDEIAVDGFVGGQFRVKGGGQQVSLFHQDGQSACLPKNFDAFSYAPDDGRADEDHFHGLV